MARKPNVRRTARTVRPTLEAIEPRTMLSVTGIIAANATPQRHLTRGQAARLTFPPPGFLPQPGGIDSKTALDTNIDPVVIASGNGVPTPHEKSRNYFQAKFYGEYVASQGRTRDIALTVRLRTNGTWTNVLKGDVDSVFSTPRKGTNELAVGFVQLNPRSLGVIGQLMLRLQARPGDLAKPTPRKFTWVVDPNSSGVYANAVGQGIAQIAYAPAAKTTHRQFGHGAFWLKITGTLITSGLPQ